MRETGRNIPATRLLLMAVGTAVGTLNANRRCLRRSARQHQSMRRFYFPLRSSVELFPDPTSVEAGTRAKEAAVLYDEVLFEDGLLSVSVGDSGLIQMWRPPHEITENEIMASRTLGEPGQNFTLAVGRERERGVAAPQKAMRTILNAKLQQAYAAEWHSSAIEELAELEVPWAQYGSVSDADMATLAGPIKSLKAGLEKAGKDAGMPTPQAGFASGALAQDAVVAARIGAAFSITSLFEPMLESLDLTRDQAGRAALAVAIPNVGGLPWEVIAEYREHGGARMPEEGCGNWSSGHWLQNLTIHLPLPHKSLKRSPPTFSR